MEVTALEVRRPEGIDRIMMQHRPPEVVTIDDLQTDAEIALLRYDPEGQRVASGIVSGTYAAPHGPVLKPSQAPDENLLAEPMRVDVLNEHAVRLSWSCRELVRMTVQYGHEVGGGYLFEASTPPESARTGQVTIGNLATGLPHIYRAEAIRETGAIAWRGTGRFTAAPPSTFDFESHGVEKWGSRRIVSRVPEGTGQGRFCLKASHAAASGAKYITVRRTVHWLVTGDSRLCFDYRTEARVPGKWYYFKVTVKDAQKEDWSAYLAKQPTAGWQHADLSLTDFRADTYKHQNRAATLPAGAQLKALSFTQRKGEAGEASEQSFWVDNVGLREAP